MEKCKHYLINQINLYLKVVFFQIKLDFMVNEAYKTMVKDSLVSTIPLVPSILNTKYYMVFTNEIFFNAKYDEITNDKVKVY